MDTVRLILGEYITVAERSNDRHLIAQLLTGFILSIPVAP